MALKRKKLPQIKSRGPQPSLSIATTIYVAVDQLDPGKLVYTDQSGLNAKNANVRRNQFLNFESPVGSLAICFNKPSGSVDRSKKGGYADVNNPIRFHILPNSNRTIFDYSVALFVEGWTPISDDPQIIITS